MYLANFHPLLVHLPIGILFLVAILELVGIWFPQIIRRETGVFMLGVSALFAVLSALSGWLLGRSGGYDENALDLHRWMAVAFTLSSFILLGLKLSKRPWAPRAYTGSLVLAILLLTLTGHYGGNLTHGEDFLFTNRSATERVIEDIDQALVRAQVIQPILDRKCTSCHNASKIKGGLRLDAPEWMLRGGESGPLLDSMPEWEGSLLIHRVRLAPEIEEHMPPEGKPQLTAAEISLLDWWISQGACLDCRVADLEIPAALTPVLEDLETDDSFRGRLAREIREMPDPELLETLKGKGISIHRLAEDNPLVRVSFLRRTNLTASDFSALDPLADRVVEIDLSFSNFSDSLSGELRRFGNTTKLNLQNTPLGRSGLRELGSLPHLESLSVFGAGLDTLVAEDLPVWPALRDFYITPGVLARDAADLLASRGIVPIGPELEEAFRASRLSPPVILAETDIFQDSLRITLESAFEAAKIVYATPGSSGDTLRYPYSGPFYLDRSAELLAYSEMEGWGRSDPARAVFLKRGYPMSRITLEQAPHPKYAAQGGETLVNDKRGTENFVDGQWVGYERSNLLANLELAAPARVHAVTIGHLSAPNSWIFSPVGYRLWGASRNGGFRLLSTRNLPPNGPSTEVSRNLVVLEAGGEELVRLRLEVINQGTNPDWHPAPGGGSFIFIDEILVN